MNSTSQAQLRRVQVFGISLTEMILILLFLMFLVAKNALDGKKGAIDFSATCGRQLAVCTADLKSTQTKLNENERQIAKFKQWVASLMTSLGMKPLLPADSRFISDVEKQMTSRLGGTGKPSCLKSSSYLVDLLMDDGFITAARKWNAQDEAIVSSIPSVRTLVDSGRLPFSTFMVLAGKISSAKPDCLFNVTVTDRTTRKETYKPQMLSIERHFKRRVLN